jgi:hypothetical protein
MKVYESIIEICMREALDQFEERSEKEVRKLRALRKLNPVSRDEFYDVETQESALLDLLWRRACVLTDRWGSNGYVGSFQNCVFSLLYGLFSADILAFLFDRAWVPAATINPFRPEPFLHRLAALERAAKKLKDGARTPVRLPETVAYIRAGMGPELNQFSERKHRLLLESSLRELRNFGELGLSLQQQGGEKQTVDIQITIFEGDYDPEILAFAELRTN